MANESALPNLFCSGAACGARPAIPAFMALASMAPECTVGPTALSSANSAVWRVMYFGSYNWLMKEMGLPDTSESFTLVQSSPVVLSTMAQPSNRG